MGSCRAAVVAAVALVVVIAPATAAPGACVALRCFNTVPGACCPARFIDKDTYGGTLEQVVSASSSAATQQEWSFSPALITFGGGGW